MTKQKNQKNIGVLLRHWITDGSTRVKIFFLFLSVFLWLLIKLSKEGYDAHINFSVDYVNLPAKYTFEEAPPSVISVHLRAQGFNILKYKLQSFKTLKVDVSRLESGRLEEEKSYWITNNNLAFFENQFGTGVDVISLSPDTVFFSFSRVSQKKVPIDLNMVKKFPKLINIYKKPVLIPDSVIIEGPEDLLSAISSIPTEQLELTAEEETVSVSVPLTLPNNPVFRFSTTETQVNIRFTQMTQGSFEIPIELTNSPEQFDIKIFPKKVNLTYHVAVEDFSKVTPADFRIYTNASVVAKNPDQRYLNLESDAYPAFVNYVNFEPKRVEFILTEK